MRKIFTLSILCFIAYTIIAQDATIKKLSSNCPAVILDGVNDGFWARVEEFPIDIPIASELPTFKGAWQAVWNDTAIFVFVTIIDDIWCPSWCSGKAQWESDKPEVYFDMNVGELDDGIGPNSSSVFPSGHYQMSPAPSTSQTTDTSNAAGWTQVAPCRIVYGYHIIYPNEYWEYAASRKYLTDKHGNTVNLSKAPIIGFDVTFVDRDSANEDRKRASWKNNGGPDGSTENWANMDEAGEITFSNEVITCDVGINTNELIQISVYPNPAENIITLNAGDEIYLYNAIGQLVFNQQIISSTVDISDVESGLYIMSVLQDGVEIGSTYLLVK